MEPLKGHQGLQTPCWIVQWADNFPDMAHRRRPISCSPAGSRMVVFSSHFDHSTVWSLSNVPRNLFIFPQLRIDGSCRRKQPFSPDSGRRGSSCVFTVLPCISQSSVLRRALDTRHHKHSAAIIGLCSRAECPSWCEDRAEPPHNRPVHCWRSGLQVRVVLQLRWLCIFTVLPAGSPNSVRCALIRAAVFGRFQRRRNAA